MDDDEWKFMKLLIKYIYNPIIYSNKNGPIRRMGEGRGG